MIGTHTIFKLIAKTEILRIKHMEKLMQNKDALL